MPLEIEKTDGGLKLTLTKCGKEFLKDNRNEENTDWVEGTNYIYLELLEGAIQNGWETLPPEEIGALTDGIILSNEVDRDDYGKILKLGKVYWYPNYQIRSEIDDLWETGECILEGVED